MSSQRPFEKGDLVVFKRHEYNKRRIETVIDVTKDYVLVTGGIYFEPYTGKPKAGFKHFTTIKTIRKPRKGSAEARDIVAMLGRESNITHNTYIRQLKHALSSYQQDYDNFEYDSEIVESKNQLLCLIENQKEYIRRAYKNKKFYALGDLYRKAKSMLK